MSLPKIARDLRRHAASIPALKRAYAGLVTRRKQAYDALVRRTRHVIDRTSLARATDARCEAFGSPETVHTGSFTFQCDGFRRPLPWEPIFDSGVTHDRPFLLTLRNCELIGHCGVVLDAAGNLVLESTENEWQYFASSWCSPEVLFRRRTKLEHLPGRVVSLASPLCCNYFHFITSNLAAIACAIHEIGDRFQDVRFLVEERVPFQAALLRSILRIPEERIILWRGGRTRVDELLIPSCRHVRVSEDCHAHKRIHSAVAYRRIHQLAQAADVAAPSDASPLIIIERRNGPRRLLNLDQLQARLHPIGFRTYDLASMSVPDQIGLFRQARVVVGVHGAGLTNLLFSPRAALIELFPATRSAGDTGYYAEIARAINLPYLLMATEGVGPEQNVRLTAAQIDRIAIAAGRFAGSA